MGIIIQLVQNHMDIVFFIYGLSFFSLGLSVFFQVRKGSDFRIGHHLWMLAAFGFLHGLNEWLDLFLMVKTGTWTAQGIQVVEVVRFFIGQTSYLFLLQFGLMLLCAKKKYRWVPKVSLDACILLIAIFLFKGYRAGFSDAWVLGSDVAMRYLLAFPSAFLTAFAFFAACRDPEIARLDTPSVSRGMIGLGFSFLIYAVLAGWIVKPADFFPASVLNYTTFMNITGLPVQFFRAGCAVSMVFFLSRVLNVFEYEAAHKLDNAYREIIRISNREQMRIGQDLHDDLGQQLTGIAYMSRALSKKMHPQSLDEADDILIQIRTLLDRSIDTTRNLSRGLYPVSIEKEGLGFALQELAENTEKIFGVSCSVHIDDTLKISSNETSIQLFRIAQEAVTNAIKHGQARKIDIAMTRGRRVITFYVVDDGSGISDKAREQSGMGLKIMRYRAGVLGGQLKVRQRSRGGTLVVVRLRNG